MKARYSYDVGKRMWARHSSTCCGTELEQKMLFQDKVVTDPNFKLAETGRKPKNVKFRYYCVGCGKENNGVWAFLHEDKSPKLNPNKEKT